MHFLMDLLLMTLKFRHLFSRSHDKPATLSN